MKATVGLTLLILGMAVFPAVSAPAASVVVRGVNVEIRLDKAAYGVGEPVATTLALTNTASASATFRFPTGLMYDFVVTHDGQRIWQWSSGRVFIQAFTTLRLDAGETKTFMDRWDQRNTRGQQVASGVYEMTVIFPVGGGGLAPMGAEGPRVQFTIIGRSMPSGPPGIPSATSRPVTVDGAAGGDVLIDSQVALQIRASADGFSASRRAEIVAARLRLLFAKHLRPAELSVVPVGTEAAIVWRRQLVVTVGPDDAREAKTTPIELAREWLRSLTQALPVAP